MSATGGSGAGTLRDAETPALRLVRSTAGPARPALSEFLGACRGTSDDALAELIETDGRTRLRDGETLALADYLGALPSLRQMPVALDAAIDMALRSRSRASRPSVEAVASLIADHPDLEPKIREAALLGQALWSTNQTAYATSRFVAKLPCEFGQRLPDGSAPYRLLRRLGEGASGEVLLAEDLRLSEPESPAFVAIKALAAAPDDPWSRRRLVDEAAKARRVDHPNVVRALHTGVSEQGDDYIVYEHVLGVDLETWAGARGLPLEPRVAASIMERVSRAVQAAHTAGLTHCDLKPANILMTEDGEPKVTDFGAAVRWKQGEALRGESGRVGTLAFMAPEQYRQEEGAGAPPADVYALGGLLYWLLTGQLPNGASPQEIGFTHDERIGRREAPAPSRLRREVDADLDAICRRALATRPGDRSPSSGALADDLRAWLTHRPLAWRSPSALRRVHLWRRRRPLSAAMAVVAAVGLGVSIGVYVRLSRVAVMRAEETRISEAKREIAEKFRADAKVQADAIGQLVAPFQTGGIGEMRMLSTVIMESLFGPNLLDDPAIVKTWRESKLSAAREMIRESRTPSGRPMFATLIWRTQLSLWLLRQGDWKESREQLAAAREEWGGLMAPDDLWRAAIDAMEACADANEAIAAGSNAEPAINERVPARLRDQIARFSDRNDWGPMRELCMDRLAAFFEAPPLADAKTAAAIREEMAATLAGRLAPTKK